MCVTNIRSCLAYHVIISSDLTVFQYIYNQYLPRVPNGQNTNEPEAERSLTLFW